MVRGWLISLTLTLLLELVYARFWGIREKHDLLLTALVNILTNPVVVFVSYFIHFRGMKQYYGLITTVMEILAVVTEALLFKKYSRTISRPWLFSLSANAFSFAVGKLINKF